MKKIDIPDMPRIEIKKKSAGKKKMLAEVLVGAAVAAGVTYTVKQMLEKHHKPKKAKTAKKTKKTAKKKTKAKKSKKAVKAKR